MKHGIAVVVCVATFLIANAFHHAHGATPGWVQNTTTEEWEEWSDVSFAPPGWDCMFQHELDLGECEVLPGWIMVFDKVLKENILIRPAYRELDTRTAREWQNLTPYEQWAIKTGTLI